MSKSVLVIDTPKNCDECLLKYDYLHCIIFENRDFGTLTNDEFKELREGYRYTGEHCDYRPRLCPLKPLPEKKKEDYIIYQPSITIPANEYHIGYNDCIDDILGEENE